MLRVLFVCLIGLSGCGTVVKYLDSTWTDDHKSYDESKTLPPLEVPPELKKE